MKYKALQSVNLLRKLPNIFFNLYMENKIILSSLAMDLKRVALGIYRKSYGVSDRFLLEAMKRQKEIDRSKLLPYMQTIIKKIGMLAERDNAQKADDALMYSTRIQNYVLYK